ncbi:phage baseplate protein [Bartonella sp. LJL80]
MSKTYERLEEAALSLGGPSSAADRVFIMESDGYGQCFPDARPLTLKVNDQARMAQHPLEDGSTITDHLVIDPISIEIAMIFIHGFRDTHAQIKAAYEEGRLLTIQTKTHTYPNMVITALPHDETTDYWDVILVNLKLEEARFITPEQGMLGVSDVVNSSDASTLNRGSQQSSPSTAGEISKVLSIYQAARL